MNHDRYKQVLVIRRDLKMRRGKECAQAAHASMGVILDLIRDKNGLGMEDPRAKPWLDGAFTKVCVYVDSEEALLELASKAKSEGLLHCLITDSGKTEFHGVPTRTVLAVGPDIVENVNRVTGDLPLY